MVRFRFFQPYSVLEKTLHVLCEAVDLPVGTGDIQVHNEVWTTPMARKRRWAARQGFNREAGEVSTPLDLESARIVYSDLVGYQTSDIRLLWTIITKP